MKKTLFIIAIFSLFTTFARAEENYYFIGLTDKIGTLYDINAPEEFLSDKALLRRKKLSIPIDESDLPISKKYVDFLQSYGIKIIHPLKWVNGVIAIADSDIIPLLEEVDFIDFIEKTHDGTLLSKPTIPQNKIPVVPTASAPTIQNQMIGVDRLHQAGYMGQGVDIAVIDAGFANVNQNPYFSHLWNRNAIFFEENISNVEQLYGTQDHGAMVLSIIAAQGTDYQGAAPWANFALLSSECADIESFIETDFLARAIEIADSVGVDIMNISLGYHAFDNSEYNLDYSKMDGKTYRSSIAAQMAVEKGIVCCVSAGNSGMSKVWPYIDTPGDAPGVISVGAVDNQSVVASFSSLGPNAEGVIRPTLCAQGLGTSIVTSKSIVSTGNGTSYAAPLMTGAIASLMSAYPQINPFELVDELIKTGSNYETPDNSIGYGIPDIWKVYKKYEHTKTVECTTPDITLFCANNLLYIDGATDYDYQICDIVGRTILRGKIGKNETFVTVPIDQLNAGIYLFVTPYKTIKFIK